MIDLHAIVARLATKRPLFHSEADFQHALAWELHHELPDARVRLEYRPFPSEAVYVDIWVEREGMAMALELKYLTKKLDVTVGGEAFSLRNQSAEDVNRYLVLKDIVRIERIVDEVPDARGMAVILTNDAGYWKKSIRDTIDAHFRLHDGRDLTGTLAWSEKAGTGTTRGIANPLDISGIYKLAWRDYSIVTPASAGHFRYLLLEALPQTDLAGGVPQPTGG